MKNTTGNTEAGSRAVSKNKRIVRTGLLVAAVVLLCFLVLMIINRPRQADYEVLYLPFSDVMNISASGISEDFNCFINDKGQVAGNYRQGGKVNISYLWDEKNGLVELAVVKDKYCFIQDINNKGQAVGYVSDIDYNGWHGECEAFFMDTDRTITLLPIDEDAGAYACGINDKGVVVGLIYLAPFHQFELEKNKQVFVWDKVGGMRIIDEIGDDVEFVCGINRAGQIAGLLKGEESGYDAFSWSESGGFVSLDVEAEWICDINEEGSILGITYFEEELFVWDEDNGVELLDAKGDWVDGCGMNDAADIVWAVYDGGIYLLGRFVLKEGDHRSFLWLKDGETVSFDHLFKDGERFCPVDINNNGWIVGYVTDRSNLRRRVVVLRPK